MEAELNMFEFMFLVGSFIDKKIHSPELCLQHKDYFAKCYMKYMTPQEAIDNFKEYLQWKKSQEV
jgi:hypothetical protein